MLVGPSSSAQSPYCFPSEIPLLLLNVTPSAGAETVVTADDRSEQVVRPSLSRLQ